MFFFREWTICNVRSRKSSSSSKLSLHNTSGNGSGNGGKAEKAGPGGGLFSKKVVYTLLLTNLFSLLIGAGLG